MRRLFTFAGIINLAYAVFVANYIFFSNPDMAQGRLLITYWAEWLSVVVTSICGYFLIVEGGKK